MDTFKTVNISNEGKSVPTAEFEANAKYSDGLCRLYTHTISGSYPSTNSFIATAGRIFPAGVSKLSVDTNYIAFISSEDIEALRKFVIKLELPLLGGTLTKIDVIKAHKMIEDELAREFKFNLAYVFKNKHGFYEAFSVGTERLKYFGVDTFEDVCGVEVGDLYKTSSVQYDANTVTAIVLCSENYDSSIVIMDGDNSYDGVVKSMENKLKKAQLPLVSLVVIDRLV